MNLDKLKDIKENAKDFQQLVVALKAEQIKTFKTNASNIETTYTTQSNETLVEPAADFKLSITADVDQQEVIRITKLHQQAKLDFFDWLQGITQNGVSYWEVDLEKGTCTYFDLNDNTIFTEYIPNF